MLSSLTIAFKVWIARWWPGALLEPADIPSTFWSLRFTRTASFRHFLDFYGHVFPLLQGYFHRIRMLLIRMDGAVGIRGLNVFLFHRCGMHIEMAELEVLAFLERSRPVGRIRVDRSLSMPRLALFVGSNFFRPIYDAVVSKEKVETAQVHVSHG